MIYRAGRFLSVETNFGVKLMFDGDGSAQVHLNCQYANLQCGLLGNADSDPSNDYETPDGILLTSNDKKQYGDSWLLPSEDPARCEQETSEPECSEEDLGKAVKVCEKVKQDPFTICHNAVQFSNTLMSCMYDTCASNDTQIYCYHLQNYYDQCELAGIDNFLWRNVTNCPLECGINEKFESCGCDSTCAEGKCDANIKCNEGCFCKPGFVRNPSNNECVSESTCRCQFETTDPDDTNRTMTLLLEKNQSLVTKNCTKRCRCLDPLGNKQRCLDMSCEATQECNKIQKIDYDKYDKPMDEVCKLKPDKPDKLWCVKPSKNLGPPDPEWVAPNACCGSKPYNTNKKFCCVEDRLSKTPCTKKRR